MTKFCKSYQGVNDTNSWKQRIHVSKSEILGQFDMTVLCSCPTRLLQVYYDGCYSTQHPQLPMAERRHMSNIKLVHLKVNNIDQP